MKKGSRCPTFLRRCDDCDTPYMTGSKKSKFCSRICGARSFRKNNPLRISELNDDFHSRNPLYKKDKWLQNRYGITLKDYDAMLVLQNGKCAICKEPETAKHQKGTIRSLAVDHDHSTGQVRQLLCSRCNGVLGKVGESLFILKTMIEYLNKHQQNGTIEI